MNDQKRGGLPLAGLRVVDASTILAGPMLATYLGDFGAEVIKVEHPTGDPLRNAGRQKEGKSLEWKLVSRNKKPVTLNLGKPEGQELFMKLTETADVVITNFRPQTLKKWGISYETLSARNPGLILVQVSGFGVEGPYSDRPGFGTLAEALSGFAEINGYPDRGPLLPNLALADQATALLGAYATMVAVYERDHSENGKGQFIDLPIYEALMGMLGNQVMEFDQLGILPKRMGNRTQWTVPRNLYQTSDGKWVAISGSSQPIVERILKAVEREDLIADPKFKDNQTRLQHAEEIEGVIAEWISRHTQTEVLARFHECDATIAPTYTVEDIFKDPHFQERGNIVEVPDGDFGKIKMLNTAPKLSRTPGRIRHSGLDKGACNDEVYSKLGLSKAAMNELKKNEII
ncbi:MULTISPECIES: CoA transferase [unclassified Paenibacillus]|uniref:CaiB/BaiF CoA transferase family protein n=1 Tax=unclassified Paenibacillus TaxID=185978 RepID=UPI001AE56E62|nr:MULTISPECIES: CoA transferase [unclassified Paenibacillus]MBP1153745.1 formyl-CoA transferase [Paenibacillus sp. PvP091]MBP1170870.1 formyl-CoA transferase [Paenibacillus sp. PvR098]MBP2441898.1 formyl-CoA transferase [Paenibacillus sp. PvP052]